MLPQAQHTASVNGCALTEPAQPTCLGMSAKGPSRNMFPGNMPQGVHILKVCPFEWSNGPRENSRQMTGNGQQTAAAQFSEGEIDPAWPGAFYSQLIERSPTRVNDVPLVPFFRDWLRSVGLKRVWGMLAESSFSPVAIISPLAQDATGGNRNRDGLDFP
jgi:hypothetical protein